VRNRLALAPVKTFFGTPDGKVSKRHLAYYRRRAEGGVGLVISEPLFVDVAGKEHPKQLGADRDDQIPGLQDLVQAVHDAGAGALAHLNHAGLAANPKASGRPPEAPSIAPCPPSEAEPTVLSSERVKELVRAYADAARRVCEAGFDGVEVQCGLGYLIAQFLSPRCNRRSDEYGAVGDNRWRFAREVIEAVREAIGTECVLCARLSADEKIDGGLALDDGLELARHLEQWGADAIHVVSGSKCGSPPWYFQHMALPEGVNERLAGKVKQAVTVPVLVAGRLGEPDRIRQVLGQGLADMVALGRPLVADPDLPRKIEEGRENEIMRCGSCLQGCLARMKAGGELGCSINPEVGREGAPAAAADIHQRVVVVGGGPAGMQAALSARRQGHHVILLERQNTLGGQYALAPLAPGKRLMERPLLSMVRAVESSGIDIETGVEATADDVLALQPDLVVVATGSRPLTLPAPGLEDALSAAEVLTGARDVGQRVLVVGGGTVGIEVAEWLAARGREVAVVEVLAEVARDMETMARVMTMKRLKDLPVTVHAETELLRISDGEVTVRRPPAGDEQSLGHFDSVVVSVGQKPYDPLSEALRNAGVRVIAVGDAVTPGQVFDATHSAYQAVSF
jgi:2,4-dienoyl-CoA reductase-like NADH-dependent reductase (Old Yellow Enzyme family)/thioredoxin reductase